jgi:hypothetical protein
VDVSCNDRTPLLAPLPRSRAVKRFAPGRGRAELKPKLKTFHATMHVTRAEEWCVEAESAEEARELLAAGEGHRCHLGDRLHVVVDNVLDD